MFWVIQRTISLPKRNVSLRSVFGTHDIHFGREIKHLTYNLEAFYYSAFGSLSSHAHNWFISKLALQEFGTLHTTWRYSDRIAL